MTQKKTPKHDPKKGKKCTCKSCQTMKQILKDFKDIISNSEVTSIQGFIPPFTASSSNPTLDPKNEK